MGQAAPRMRWLRNLLSSHPFRRWPNSTEVTHPNSLADIRIAGSAWRPPYDVVDENWHARRRYGPILLWSYIGLVAALTVGTLLVWSAVSLWGRPSEFTSGLRSVQDFVGAMLGGLSPIAGFAGFVVGRYFSTTVD